MDLCRIGGAIGDWRIREGASELLVTDLDRFGTDIAGKSRASFADLAPVQKRLRSFSAQFHDFRPVRAQIATARRRTRAIGLHEGLD
jgi:hypothetical protein